MRDNKAFASLSSGLLARKGQARPAMRPQGFGFNTTGLDDLGWNDMGHDAPAPRPVTARLPANLAGPATSAPMPVEVPQVVRQQEEIAREFAAPVEPAVVEEPVVEPVAEIVAEAPAPVAPKPKAAPKKAKVPKATVSAPKGVAKRAEGRKAAFTLRLDTERHLRLRLACAVQNRSAQLLVTDALDQLLESLPDVARLAASLPAKD
ncbi:hypothetical protein HZF05_20690 [Sphingomonas sp. CGMCC 1.13654]|uniref:Uncharacterized protein n=1 Tax=Sphingomonas chungangi TaxID=2683589 RepID=A0A838LEE8_9SPHN|nr:hypothetical protein [Sphingomonas chungangi]MBA2936506.1 hypothetical protein [Sphingomonas chungangi]MVW55891.1 hypothetical protein [Sphingomonas chungangi]